MCLLLETIKIEDGEIRNPDYHNRRFNESRRIRFGSTGTINLLDRINIPPDMRKGVYRCRVLYREDIEEILFVEHREPVIRSLKMVYCDDIEYSFKYADREKLVSLYEQRGECDEVLIIRNGFVTDTSISNVVLRRKDGSWATPGTCLLKGTMRTCLLEKGMITEESIRPDDLPSYTGLRMINCMMGLDSGPIIPVKMILP